MSDPVFQGVEELKASPEYQNYLVVRRAVLKMLGEAREVGESVSEYWRAQTAGFEYMIDASPLVVQRLREHCHHLTGVRSYEYLSHHSHEAPKYAKKLHALKKADPVGLFVAEAPQLGGFGHSLDGQLTNLDTLKFYEALIAINKAGLLQRLREGEQGRFSVLEIGGGWGGLAYQFKSLLPRGCYTIVDLPQALLFSATYLKTLFPLSSAYLYGEEPLSSLIDNHRGYDFVFLPHYRSDIIASLRVDLALNTVSFQEMSTGQVSSYVEALFQAGCPSIYSLNRDRSPHNRELTSVREILATRYQLKEIRVLKVPYTTMIPAGWRGRLLQIVHAIGRTLRVGGRGPSPYEYRHIVGRRKATGLE